MTAPASRLDLRAFPARIGELIVSPRRGLARIEADGGGLRDALGLVVLGVLTFRLPELCRALLAMAGPTSGVFFRLIGLFIDEAREAAWVVLPAAVIITLLAGKRRDASRDLDLGAACYAPFFALRGLARVIDGFAGMRLFAPALVNAIAGVGALAVLVPAVIVARRRLAPSGAAPGAPPERPAAPAPRASRVGAAVVLLSLVAFGANAVWAARHLDTLQPIRRGAPAPGFALARIDGTAGTIDLGALRGQVVVLDFWATWCPPCVAMLPILDDVHHDWEPRGVSFVGINSDGGGATREEIEAFLHDHRIPYPVVADDGSVGSLYKVEALPSLIVIGRDGTLRQSFVGYTTQSALDHAIRDAVSAN